MTWSSLEMMRVPAGGVHDWAGMMRSLGHGVGVKSFMSFPLVFGIGARIAD